MPPAAQLAAARTRDQGAGRLGYQNEAAVLLDDNQHDLPAICGSTQRFGHHGSPRLPR
jgi:hypothetical protein